MNLKKLAITLPAPICIVASISAFITYINHGLTADFASQWLKSFLFSLVVILPIAGLLIMKLAQLVERRLPHIQPLSRKLILCGLIALSLESIISLMSVISTSQADSVSQFIAFWALTLLKALPLGYLIAMIMVFIVRPKIQRALAAA